MCVCVCVCARVCVHVCVCVPVTGAVDMSPKPSQVTLTTTTPELEPNQSDAISLINKPSARAVARKDSVGIPLIVEPAIQESTCQKQPQTTICMPKQQTLGRKVAPILHQPLPSSIIMQCSSVSETNDVSQSIIQSHSLSTAPANSVKGTLDMSTKECKSDTVLYYSDPVSLVRTRPSNIAYSQRDYAGVPLIVETHSTQEQPKRQEIQVGSQEQMQRGFVQSGSREVDQRASFFCFLGLGAGLPVLKKTQRVVKEENSQEALSQVQLKISE